MWNKIIVILTIVKFLSCQIQGRMYFPDQLPSTQPYANSINSGLNEQYIYRIISRGILKLFFEIDKANMQVMAANNQDSVVYSPVNIATALAMLLLGSNGKTFQELSSVIDLEGQISIESFHKYFGKMLENFETSTGSYTVNSANAVFLQEGYPIGPEYKSTTESIYHSQIFNVDFQNNPSNAQQIINTWVSEKTNGKINQLFHDSPPRNTKVILASAMYFKAEWEIPFFDDSTRRRPFYTNGRKTESDVMIDMMIVGGEFPYFKDNILNCEIFGLPYKGNRTTMYVIVPKESNKNKLKQLESQLNYSQIERLVNNVRYREVHIGFPKMRIDGTNDLKRSLEVLGIKSLFNPSESNLSLLSPGTSEHSGLYADNVIHKVCMDITETGTEAAVVTATTLEKGGDVVAVGVNVPFFFFIMNEETKALLFWGSVYTPTPHF